MQRALAAMTAVNSGKLTLEEASTTYGFADKTTAHLAILAAQKYDKVRRIEDREDDDI